MFNFRTAFQRYIELFQQNKSSRQYWEETWKANQRLQMRNSKENSYVSCRYRPGLPVSKPTWHTLLLQVIFPM